MKIKKLVPIIFFLFLTGCSITPSLPKFPEPPKELMESCSDLKLIPEGETKLSKTLDIVLQNYGMYHECATKTETWINWYTEQKKIYMEIK